MELPFWEVLHVFWLILKFMNVGMNVSEKCKMVDGCCSCVNQCVLIEYRFYIFSKYENAWAMSFIMNVYEWLLMSLVATKLAYFCF